MCVPLRWHPLPEYSPGSWEGALWVQDWYWIQWLGVIHYAVLWAVSHIREALHKNFFIIIITSLLLPPLFLHNLQDQVEVVREPPPVPPAPEKSPSSPSNLEDNEPLYDSVCSDDDYGDVSENANLKNGGNVNMAHHANQNTTVRRF